MCTCMTTKLLGMQSYQVMGRQAKPGIYAGLAPLCKNFNLEFDERGNDCIELGLNTHSL